MDAARSRRVGTQWGSSGGAADRRHVAMAAPRRRRLFVLLLLLNVVQCQLNDRHWLPSGAPTGPIPGISAYELCTLTFDPDPLDSPDAWFVGGKRSRNATRAIYPQTLRLKFAAFHFSFDVVLQRASNPQQYQVEVRSGPLQVARS